MKYLLRIMIFFLLLVPFFNSYGGVKVGTGLSSLTAGRIHPLLYLSLDPSRYSLTFSSVGFKHQYGYYSGYNSAFFYNFGSKTFEAGLGWGITYISAGYRDNENDSLETGSAFSTGPAVKTFWHATELFFLGLQGTFGIDIPTIAGLALQDNVSFVVGLDF